MKNFILCALLLSALISSYLFLDNITNDERGPSLISEQIEAISAALITIIIITVSGLIATLKRTTKKYILNILFVASAISFYLFLDNIRNGASKPSLISEQIEAVLSAIMAIIIFIIIFLVINLNKDFFRKTDKI